MSCAYDISVRKIHYMSPNHPRNQTTGQYKLSLLDKRDTTHQCNPQQHVENTEYIEGYQKKINGSGHVDVGGVIGPIHTEQHYYYQRNTSNLTIIIEDNNLLNVLYLSLKCMVC